MQHNTNRTSTSSKPNWLMSLYEKASQASAWIGSRIPRLSKASLALAVALPVISYTHVSTAHAESKLQLQGEDILTSGAILKNYIWSTERSGKSVSVQAKVIQVDLQNPYVKLDVMTGTGGQFTKKQTVLGMASETGAVGGVNGDYYNTQYEGVPVGPQITNGQLMATPPYLPGFYTFGITKDRKPMVELFTLDTESKIIAKDGASYTLGGINKTAYWYEPSGVHSMIDGLYMYTSAWAQISRANDGVTGPLEVLVVNNVVKEIATSATNGVLQQIAPADGYILRSSGKAADFIREHVKVGDPIRAEYNVYPADRNIQVDYKQFQMMIGGHTILVDEGKPSYFSRSINDVSGYAARSRTAVGYSQDQRYVYLVTADLSGESKGVTIPELQQLMIQVGVWKGMNLDGGGSTQMVARPLGENGLQVVNSLETGSQRKVVNGLGVYSLAPKGQVKGLKVEGPEVLLVGEKATYTLKGYDEFYNPVTSGEIKPQWSVTPELVQSADNTFTATKKGTATLTVQADQAKESRQIQVVGSEELTSLKVTANPPVMRAGETVALKVTATTKSGATRTLSPSLLTWEMRGFQGTVTDEGLKVQQLQDPQGGLLIGTYDGYKTMTPLSVGETKIFADFEKLTYPLSFESTDGVTGVAKLSAKQSYQNGYFGHLEYDFTKGSGTKAAYAVLANKTAAVPGEPQAIQLEVNGDESLNWLRAEFIDGDGDINRVDLAKNINWKGWKTITADLTSHHMTYPVTLTRIYVASVEDGQDERNLTGAIDFDTIRFQYKNAAAPLPRNQVTLTIDKRNVQVNGQSQTIDQEPYIVDGNTLVPLRFVTEALGGAVEWDGAQNKVTIIRGQNMMVFQLGQKDYLADGARKTAEVAAELKNERTMVPLRVLTEYMGWKVTWDQNTRKVVLE